MEIVDRLRGCLSEETLSVISENCASIAEIRLRPNCPVRLRMIDGEVLSMQSAALDTIRAIACKLMEESIYAREEELRQGYFTGPGGCRVGVCGKVAMEHGRVKALASIASVCIRFAREVKGCAEGLLPVAQNFLILSPPGLGKTTLLRDLARLLSNDGKNVAIADERREICACVEGVPQLDVGENTDVIDGCPKAIAIPMLIRACAPEIIIADEIGSDDDAFVLQEAVRCGVRIVATAHASSLEDAWKRRRLALLLQDGIFEDIALITAIGRFRRLDKNTVISL